MNRGLFLRMVAFIARDRDVSLTARTNKLSSCRVKLERIPTHSSRLSSTIDSTKEENYRDMESYDRREEKALFGLFVEFSTSFRPSVFSFFLLESSGWIPFVG